jgi:exodeoxyribonuclease III
MGIFKIATYNVNSIRSRLHIIMPWLHSNRPDAFCMQETKVEDDKFPIQEFIDAGYHVSFRGEKSYNGIAMASLEKPDHLSFGFSDGGPHDESRLMRAVVSGISILNTYVPQGRERASTHFTYKLEWFHRLHKLLEKSYSAAAPLIWCGDLNVAPESIDVHDPKRLLGHVDFNPEVWDAFRTVTSWGLTDIFRKHHPGEAGRYTFFDYRMPKSAERGLGWRVDHILATGILAGRSHGCTIDMNPRLGLKPSDHTILTAEFEIN